jgi:hypothetical protein
MGTMSGYLRTYWSLIRRHPSQVLAVAWDNLRRLARGWLR